MKKLSNEQNHKNNRFSFDHYTIIFKIINKLKCPEGNATNNHRWESPDNNTEGIDFDEVFSHSDLDALKLISMENIVDECKKQNDKIT